MNVGYDFWLFKVALKNSPPFTHFPLIPDRKVEKPILSDKGKKLRLLLLLQCTVPISIVKFFIIK